MSRRVGIVHNTVAPYRLPLFDRLAQEYDVVVYFCERQSADRLWEADLDGRAFEYHVLPGGSVGSLRLNWNAVPVFAREEFDALLLADGAGALVTDVAAAAVAAARDVPYIVWTETVDDTEGTVRTPTARAKQSVVRGLRSLLHSGADGFVAYSRRARTRLRERGVPASRIASGPQVMPRECLAPERPLDPSDGDDGVTVLFVGYLTQRKGVGDLLAAYRQAATSESRLRIVGAGPERESLQRAVADRDDVEFSGYLSESEKSEAYRRADVFVLPTYHDVWGLVVNEALYYGVPVVVSDAAAAAELVTPGENGYVYEAGDVEALADTLSSLLLDRGLREELARHAQSTMRATDIEVGVEPFLTALSRLDDRR